MHKTNTKQARQVRRVTFACGVGDVGDTLAERGIIYGVVQELRLQL